MRRSLLPLALLGLFALPMHGAQATALTDDLQGLSKQQVEDSVEFAFGNALFFLFHEAGHMLVSEFNLPVLGREEDAVDTLSTLLLLEADDEVFDTALTDSVDGWTFSAEASEAAEEELAMWGRPRAGPPARLQHGLHDGRQGCGEIQGIGRQPRISGGTPQAVRRRISESP
ncbi:DUF4344 domain-containing metallopeptidase [Neorhizobium galegae]|nr:DUF4344 domain-containing metallopeptidase [Neorhizobium galegae]